MNDYLLALLYNTMADKTKIEIKPYLTFQSKFGSGQQKENMQCYDMYYYLYNIERL